MKTFKKIYPELLLLAFLGGGVYLIAQDFPWLAGLVMVAFASVMSLKWAERWERDPKEGPMGPPGPQGPQGEQGPPGRDGADA